MKLPRQLPSAQTVRDLMNTTPVRLHQDMSIAEAARNMRETRARYALVFDDYDDFGGLLDMRRIGRLTGPNSAGLAHEIPVGVVMERQPQNVGSWEDGARALNKLQRCPVGCLIVMDEWMQPVGLLTSSSIFERLANSFVAA